MPQIHPVGVGLRARVAELAADSNAKAIAVGVAAVAITPLVLPLVKPALKATIKSGVALLERAKGTIAEAGEFLADTVAEAKAEAQLEAQRRVALQASTSVPQTAATEE